MAIVYEKKQKPLDFVTDDDLWSVPHLHKELEVIYVEYGTAQAVVDSRVYDLKKGDLLILFPNQSHYYHVPPMQGKFWILILPPHILMEIENVVRDYLPENNVISVEDGSVLEHYLQKMIAAKQPYWLPEIGAYAILTMKEILTRITLMPQKTYLKDALKSILEYCCTHFTEEISLEVLSKELHLNKSYISQVLNQQTNMSLRSFINTLRVDAACRMLRNTERSITEIAQDVGYDSIRSFNRAFSGITSMTPKDYRNRFHKVTKNSLE